MNRKHPKRRDNIVGGLFIMGKSLTALLFGLTISGSLHGQEVIELDTTTITGNTELPKSLYVVPWQDREIERQDEHQLSLHNLYGDLFDPRMPDYLDATEFRAAAPPMEPGR